MRRAATSAPAAQRSSVNPAIRNTPSIPKRLANQPPAIGPTKYLHMSFAAFVDAASYRDFSLSLRGKTVAVVGPAGYVTSSRIVAQHVWLRGRAGARPPQNLAYVGQALGEAGRRLVRERAIQLLVQTHEVREGAGDPLWHAS